MNKAITCPCCGYITNLHDEYDICELCGWELCHVQIKNPDQFNGPNSMTLFEGQQRYQAFLNGDEPERPLLRRPLPDIVRDPQWRPFVALPLSFYYDEEADRRRYLEMLLSPSTPQQQPPLFVALTDQKTEEWNIGYHFMRHVIEKGDRASDRDPFTYVKNGIGLSKRLFLKNSGMKFAERDGCDGAREQVFLDMKTGEFSVRKKDGPQSGALMTFCTIKEDLNLYWSKQIDPGIYRSVHIFDWEIEG